MDRKVAAFAAAPNRGGEDVRSGARAAGWRDALSDLDLTQSAVGEIGHIGPCGRRRSVSRPSLGARTSPLARRARGRAYEGRARERSGGGRLAAPFSAPFVPIKRGGATPGLAGEPLSLDPVVERPPRAAAASHALRPGLAAPRDTPLAAPERPAPRGPAQSQKGPGPAAPLRRNAPPRPSSRRPPTVVRTRALHPPSRTSAISSPISLELPKARTGRNARSTPSRSLVACSEAHFRPPKRPPPPRARPREQRVRLRPDFASALLGRRCSKQRRSGIAIVSNFEPITAAVYCKPTSSP